MRAAHLSSITNVKKKVFVIITNFINNLEQYDLVRLIVMYTSILHWSFQLCSHIHPKSFDAGLNGLAPAYMRELLIPYSPKRTLRSTENHLLTPPRSRLEYFGKRSFAAAAPTLWNNLPLNIKQAPSVDIFKSRIKTHLFQLAYFM